MSELENQSEIEQSPPNHWQVIRDVIVFQFKLALDGLRDLIFSPISIISALIGLIVHPNNPGIYFNEFLKYGRQTDHWINLFGASSHYEDNPDLPEDPDVKRSPTSSDEYIKKLESMLIAEYKKGGVVKGFKDSTDGFIQRVRDELKKDN